MFMLRSTCLCVLCHVYAQIYMPMCSLPCFCLDLHVSAYIYGPMLRSMCLCAPCHVLLQPFLSLDISLSCALACPVGCRSRSCGLGLHLYTQANIKGFGSFPSNVYVCLHPSMLYLHVSLSRSKLCDALCPSWACVCVVTSVPHRVCLDVTTCEIHVCGVGVLDIHLSPLRAILICLPCLLCATCLAFLVSMHLCTLAYMFMHESMCHPYSNLMELWTLNPNLHLSSQDTSFLFDNMLLCFFVSFTCLFAPVWHIFLACLQHAFPSICFFACLLPCFFWLCMYTHGARTLGVRVQPPR